MKKAKNNTSITILLVAILILVRIICASTEQILYIIYAINLVGLLYVIIQIMCEAYNEASAGVKLDSLNTIIARKNKQIRNRFILIVSGIIILAGIWGVMAYFLSLKYELSVVNDVIALITLGISIEDGTLTEWVLEKCKK